MYKIFCENTMICDSRVEDLAIMNPTINMEVNKAGYFVFTMPKIHPYRDIIQKRQSTLYVYRDDEKEPIFAGDCVSSSEDFYGNLLVECEGDLSFLNDTIQRPAHNRAFTARLLLEHYIAEHNANCEPHKHFTVGIVTVEDNYITCYSNYETTMQCIKGDLVDDLGGYLRVRHQDGVRYLDYLAESPNTSKQIIKLGENLTDITAEISTENIATVVIPLGATIEGQETIEGIPDRVTIKSVNDGKDYLESEEAIANFGRIVKIVSFDNVTTPEELKRKGQQFLSATQWENLSITATAIDLHIDNADIESFKILDTIRVVSKAHGLDKNFLISKISFDLNNPASSVVTLGTTIPASMSAKTAEAVAKVEDVDPISILDSAKANASALIKNAQNGFIHFVTDEDGRPTEMLIMDTNDIETAQKVWRWNQNGFAYSSNGYDGDYGLAMTMNGEIVADFITSGTMRADMISGGVFKVGGELNKNGEIQIYDENGVLCGVINNGGMAIYSPTTQTQTIISPAVGLSVRDADGNDYIGTNFRADIYPSANEYNYKPNFTYKDGTPYAGITSQPVKIVGVAKCYDNDTKKARITGTRTVNYITENRFEVYYVHEDAGFNDNPIMVPINVSSTSYKTEDDTVRYKPIATNVKSYQIQLPDKFKGREISVNIDVKYENPYENSNGHIFLYKYANLSTPNCLEGSKTDAGWWISTFTSEQVADMTYFAGTPHESTYINPQTYIPDEKREEFVTTFDFPTEFYDYKVEYEIDKENAIITIKPWAVGRYKNEFNAQLFTFYYDFINMTEFMHIRVMATT